MIVNICIGSSCHIKGSEQVVNLFQEAVEQHQLEDKIPLAGSFCFGCCNREGVTIQVDGEIFTAVTPETFDSFFTSTILPKL